MIKVQIDGVEGVYGKMKLFKSIIPDEAIKGLFNIALEIRNNAITGMQNTVKKSGKVYKRGTVSHRPSAPGYPAAVDKGGLVGSIVPEISNDRKEVTVGSKITDPPYPFFLEDGTVKMSARPWLDPAIETVKDDIENGLMKNIIGGIERL